MWNSNYFTNSRTQNRNPKRRNNRITNDFRTDGGYKQVYSNGPIQAQTIELYTTISLDDNGNYIFSEEISGLEYNLQRALNDNNEFLELRNRSIQYKVTYIAVSFNYNRQPNQNDKFSKMLITPETDMVLQNSDPKINKNTMTWDMTRLGTKNYDFKINTRNTEKINQEWQVADSQWNAICIFHLSSQGYNKIYRDANQPEPTRELGELKISVRVSYIKADSDNINNKFRITTQDLIKTLKQEEKDKIIKDKITQRNKYLQFQIDKLTQEKDLNLTQIENSTQDIKLDITQSEI